MPWVVVGLHWDLDQVQKLAKNVPEVIDVRERGGRQPVSGQRDGLEDQMTDFQGLVISC